ncbi:hypothetical protein AF335_21045 [Streptomyces eurocidicus]|uniref:Chorismate lyase n=1 Tax=Streptomyces eurocidicus TaxID=66423 RepID=A0A2N8NTU4_STREU|nr:chorismate pyruvate-lyase family protein [Streptomyces eurocidicus]PNE32203.1 hypothetical protein AF335_21045 [Streptomyces eurocidicus]
MRPPTAPADTRDGFPAGDLSGFRSPVTRILLASDGLTTVLLQALTQSALTPEVDGIEMAPGQHVEATARGLLRLATGDVCLVRRTRLVSRTGEVVSVNIVTARAGQDARIDTAMRDRTRPIGFAFAAAGLPMNRQISRVGLTSWPQDPDMPCAFKAYTLNADDRPWTYIRELFSPRIVPPGMRTEAAAAGERA